MTANDHLDVAIGRRQSGLVDSRFDHGPQPVTGAGDAQKVASLIAQLIANFRPLCSCHHYDAPACCDEALLHHAQSEQVLFAGRAGQQTVGARQLAW
jgi:hypothetical protein